MPSVLIVDDEPNIRRMVERTAGQRRYDLREATNGAEGAPSQSSCDPDVALVDLMMPGNMDGLASLARSVNASRTCRS